MYWRVLLLMIVVAVSACGESPEAPDGSAEQPSEIEQQDEAEELVEKQLFADDLEQGGAPLEDIWPELSAAWAGDLDGMLERREIRMLVPVSLGGYHMTRGQPSGAFYEASKLFETFAKQHLGKSARKLKVTQIPVRRDQLLPHLVAGYGDVAMGNLTVTPLREEIVDFSRPISRRVRELLVSGPASPVVNYLSDLSGKEVVTRRDASYYESLQALSARLVAEGREPIRISVIDPRLEDEDLLELLNNGLLPFIVVDEHKLGVWQQIFQNIRVREDLVLREGGHLAFAIRKQSPKIKSLVDEFARKYPVGSKITNILMNRYFERTHWVDDAIELRPFNQMGELKGLFQKYGEQYQIDWVLLAAFAYQESKYNQNARSSAGAVGIMQLLPTTAADKNVAIKDIHQLENNVHAGTKYLAFLRDRYFSSDELNGTESMLFTMAAYNAGPNRINRLRRDAKRRGLDPNRWFRNVEDVVAARVGREPVNYVGNIYRHYVAYRQTLAESEQRRIAKESLEASLQH